MSQSNQPPAIESTLPSAPFPYSKLRSKELHTLLIRGECVHKDVLDSVINTNQPKRRSPLRWVFGVQAFLELAWPYLHAKTARKLHVAWLQSCERGLVLWEAQIAEILRGGAKAEQTVNGWLSHLCKDAAPSMVVWLPANDGHEDIVFPPNEHNSTSQEFDNLLVTDHAVYVIEVKSWHEINANGGRVLGDGKELGSPIAQSKKKVEHLRKILGPDTPIKAIGVLPNLKDECIPFALDARIVSSLGQLSLMLRGEHQKAKGRPKLDVQGIRACILSTMDTTEKAKINHMRWLAEAHPSEDAERVRDLDDRMVRIKAEMDEPFAFERQGYNSIGVLVASVAIPAAVYFLGKYADSPVVKAIFGS